MLVSSRKSTLLMWFFVTMATVVSAEINVNKIPQKVLLGFATASYQIEGGWNEDGKGENTWDRLTHSRPDMIANRSTGDVAADSYHKYGEDVKLLKTIGAQVYRFSLSWSRILPKGDLSVINQQGVDYYNRLINKLIQNGVQPMITLFHWDLPQILQDIGGWTNPILIDYFGDYALLVFHLFGDRVKLWITFNEPFETCESSYGEDGGAPALNMSGIANYLAAHTVLRAHAKAYHIYDEQFKSYQYGKVGITLNINWHEPKTNTTKDKQASDDAMQFMAGWFAHPIFGPGDYPTVMKRKIWDNSRSEGRMRSRLPEFDPETVAYIRGTFDFFGLNHYSTWLVTPSEGDTTPNPSWVRDMGVTRSVDPTWQKGASSWLYVVPWGFRKLLNWIRDEYNSPDIYITENGFSDHGQLEDLDRIMYLTQYMQQMLYAIYDDGCSVIGYTVWSIMDNFEWRSGYTEKFGVYHVDFNDPNRTRTMKSSATFMRDVIRRRRLPYENANYIN